MKKIYSNQVIDLRFKVDHVNAKTQLFEENRGATDHTRLFKILITQRN